VDAHQENAAKPPFENRGRVVSCEKHFDMTDHPVCAASEAVFLFTAQPPLLYQEGNTLPEIRLHL